MPVDLFEQQNASSQGPVDLFEKHGVKQGFSGIAQDVGSAVPQLFRGVASAVKSAIPAVEDVGAMGVGGMAKNLLAGMLTAGTNAINAPYNLNQYLQNKGFKGFGDTLKYGKYIPHVPDVDYANKLGAQSSAGATFLQSLPQLATGAVAPESEFSGIPQALLKNVLTGAVQSPQNPVTGGAMGAIASAPHAVVSGVNAARPVNLLRSHLSPEELQRNLDLTKGTNAQLGEVLQNPTLKRTLENTLPDFPFSGANEALAQMKGHVESKGNEALNAVLGNNDPNNVNDQIGENLLNAHESQKAKKNSIYKEVDNLADESKLNMQFPSFREKTDEYSVAIDKANIINDDPQLKSLLEKIKNYYKPKPTVNNLTMTYDVSKPSLREANILKGKLNDTAKNLQYSSDASQRNLAGMFRKLGTSLKADIKSSIDKSGNEKLKSSYDNAELNYGKNYSPFLDKDIYKYISGKKDTNTILTDIVKPSTNIDKSIAIKKVMKVLPEDKQGLLGYGYLSRAVKDGQLDSNELARLIKNLGPRQFKALFPDEQTQAALKDFKDLHRMSQKATHNMANPATGQKLLSALPILLHTISGGAGAAIGGPMGAMAGVAVPTVIARQLTKLLTSENFRTKLVGKMIKKAKKGGQ